MTQTSAAFNRDANRQPIVTDGLITTKTITYVAGTTGAIATTAIFTVTGDVIVTVFAVCSDTITSGGTPLLEVGISGNTAALIAQLTDATTLETGEIWVDAASATVEALPSAKILTNGTDVTQKITTATLTGGTLTYYCLWRPLSATANVVAA